MYRMAMEILKEKMVAVLNDELTFEEVSNWAEEIMRKREINEVEIDPKEDRGTIFYLITFLAGMDITEPSGEYFHCKKDIERILQMELPENSRDSEVGQ